MSYRHLLENRWAENNIQYDSNEQKIYDMWNYITCGISICILAHSFILHGRKYDSVRTCTDLACILGIIPAFSTAAASVHPDLLTTVIANQIINYSICVLLLTACDMQMFVFRYCIIQRVSLQQQKVHYMVGYGFYACYLLIRTVSPCWLDMNGTSFYARIIYLSTEGIAVVIFISYILYFTWMTVRVILSLNRWERRRQKYPWQPLPGLLDSSGISTVKSENTVTPVSYCNSITHIMRNVGSLLCLGGLLGFSSTTIKPMDGDPIISNIPEGKIEEAQQQQQQSSRIDTNQVVPIEQEAAVTPTPLSEKKVERDGETSGRTENGNRGLQSAVWRWRLKVVAYKSIIHAIISIAGLIMAVTSPGTFTCTLAMQTIVTLHFLFNWRIEDIIWPVQSSGVSKGRASREFRVFKQLRKGDRVERIESAAASYYNESTGAVAAVADRCTRQIKKARDALFITLQVEIMCRRGGLLGGGGGHLSAVAPLPSNERKVVGDECVVGGGGSNNTRGNGAGKIAGEMRGRLAGVRSPPAVDGGEGGGEGPAYPHHAKEEEGKSWDQSLIRDCDRRILLLPVEAMSSSWVLQSRQLQPPPLQEQQ